MQISEVEILVGTGMAAISVCMLLCGVRLRVVLTIAGLLMGITSFGSATKAKLATLNELSQPLAVGVVILLVFGIISAWVWPTSYIGRMFLKNN